MKITFDEISIRKQVKGICKSCGKCRSRSVIESMTENPWNKNSDGTIRTRAQIYQALREKLAKQIAELQANFMCATCQKKSYLGRKVWGMKIHRHVGVVTEDGYVWCEIHDKWEKFKP